MRIIGGEHRGTRLAELGKGDSATHLRPTSDRVRESLFNILEGGRFGNPISGAVVLDLFAGTGALGLEALSRGAKSVTFVESGKTGLRLIRENIAKVRRAEQTTILTCDATKLTGARTPADLVFLDPPYGKSLGQDALLSAVAQDWLAEEAVVVWEEASAQIAPNGFSLLDQRRYGDTWITLMRYEPTP